MNIIERLTDWWRRRVKARTRLHGTSPRTTVGGVEIVGHLPSTHFGSVETVDITGGVDDYDIGDGVSIVRMSTTTGDALTGIANGSDRRRVVLLNIGSTSITLTHDSANSSAANRFYGANSATVTIRQNGAVEVIYDGTSERWRIISP